MKRLFALLLLAVLFITIGCTPQSRARNFGGTENVQLKPNEVLINVTWKDDNLWILTKDTLTGAQYFRESSSWGVWEGEIIIE